MLAKSVEIRITFSFFSKGDFVTNYFELFESVRLATLPSVKPESVFTERYRWRKQGNEDSQVTSI